MPTMDDIAKRLGISKSTVSKALNGAEDISDSMRKSVIEAAVELGYSRITRIVDAPKLCIFIQNMEYTKPEDFGHDLVNGFRQVAIPAGYSVDIVELDLSLQKQIHYDEYMLLHNYQGAFFLGITLQDIWMNDFKTCHTPTVLFDNRSQHNPSVTMVGTDNDEGIEMAVQKLMSLGHKKIGYLSAGLGSQVFRDRYLSFFRTLRKNHMDDNRLLGGHAYHTIDCLDQNLPRLLAMGCTAILCSHDQLAQTLLMHCREKGIRIPEDLSVIGIDDLPICRYTSPSLSSIRQNRTELGKSGFHALFSQINQIHINTLKLHPELIIRDSVGKAPIVTQFSQAESAESTAS